MIPDLVGGLRAFLSWFTSWVVPLTAIGTLSMAVLQTAKNLFPLRREFQRKRIRSFLAEEVKALPSAIVKRVMNLERRLDRLSAETGSERTPETVEISETVVTHQAQIDSGGDLDVVSFVSLDARTRSESMTEIAEAPESIEIGKHHIDPRKAELDLISLVAAGDENAFYDLPIDQLAAQVKTVGSVILDYSRLHSSLLVCLATKANPSDLLLVLDPPSHDPLWQESDEQKFEDKQFVKRYAAAKSRIATQLRCSIDSMQTSIAFRWKFALQLASFILSFIFGAVAVGIALKPQLTLHGLLFTALDSLAIGVVAGFIAPVARDLVAGIEKLNP